MHPISLHRRQAYDLTMVDAYNLGSKLVTACQISNHYVISGEYPSAENKQC
jgi:hypothetical protein